MGGGASVAAMTLLALRGVSKRFADGAAGVEVVLDGVSFEIGSGEVVGVQGAGRSGKTTLLRIAAGLDVPDEGEVCWEGRDLAGLSSDERGSFRRLDGIALMQGSWVAVEPESVLEYVARSIYGNRLRMGEAEGLARGALADARVSDLGHKAVNRLGARERLHVGLAHALVHRPRLLLVDEPAVLPVMSELAEFYALLHTVRERRGFALLIASQDFTPLEGARLLHLANHKIHTPKADTDTERDKVVHLPSRHGTNAP